MRRIIAFGDAHLKESFDKFSGAYLLVKKFIKKTKPDEVLIGGDFGDFASASFHDKDTPKLMENKRYSKECEHLNRELDELSKYTKKITYLEGNHEDRVNRMIQKSPNMLDGVAEVPNMLHLKERGIEWYPYNVPYRVCKDLIAVHGAWCPKYHSAKHLVEYGCHNIIYFHTHKPQTFSMNFGDPIQSWGIGCLQDPRDAGYLRRKPSGWLQQFAIIEIDKYFQVNPINIIKNSFIYSGKVWKI